MRLTILIAEDNELSQALTLHLLQKMGHTVRPAANGREVLDALASQTFDVIMLDLQMPVMDGWETAEAIRRRFDGRPRPFLVALSAWIDEGEAGRLNAAGFDGYVAKPAHRDMLQALLSNLVRGAAGPREAYRAAESAAVLDLTLIESLKAIDPASPSVFGSLVAEFFRVSEGMVQQIEAQLRREGEPGLPGLVHSLKGAALNIGARALADHCRGLEQDLRHPGSAGDARALRSIFEETRNALRAAADT